MEQGERLFEFSRAASSANDSNEIWDILKKTLQPLGVNWINYAYGNPEEELLLYSTMSEKWLSYYFENYVATDLLVHHCANEDHTLFLDKSFFKGEAGLDKQNDTMLQEVREQDTHAGMGIPLPKSKADYLAATGVFFGLSEKDSQDVMRIHGQEITLIMNAAHQFFNGHELTLNQELFSSRDGALVKSKGILTDREKDVLRYLALGIRPDRIAHQMGLEVVTVNMHLQKARRRLRATTREQAIIKALQMRQLVL
ncbi:autoinducer binding domain-containing protein [Kiloniella sp.]|uniref:autoinducer binding domain-containing protein n=1 Tax=Kiloniella sp. TaxID=1938587 RepID=UPI003B024F12